MAGRPYLRARRNEASNNVFVLFSDTWRGVACLGAFSTPALAIQAAMEYGESGASDVQHGPVTAVVTRTQDHVQLPASVDNLVEEIVDPYEFGVRTEAIAKFIRSSKMPVAVLGRFKNQSKFLIIQMPLNHGPHSG